MARPSKLTPELLARIYKRVEATGDIVGSAVAEGVHVNAVKDWLLRGEGKHRTRPKTRRFVEFVAEMDSARAVFRNNLLALEVQPTFIEERKEVTLPDGKVIKSSRVVRKSPDPKAIAEHLRRENADLHPSAATLKFGGVTEEGQKSLVDLAQQLHALASRPWVDPRDRLPARIVDVQAIPAPVQKGAEDIRRGRSTGSRRSTSE